MSLDRTRTAQDHYDLATDLHSLRDLRNDTFVYQD